MRIDLHELPDFPSLAREMIREFGLRLIEPRPLPSLMPLHEWHEDSCMGASDENKSMMIYLLRARRPGEGAFRRLVKRLTENGWSVVVVQPLENMDAICKHMGFERVTKDGCVFRCLIID